MGKPIERKTKGGEGEGQGTKKKTKRKSLVFFGFWLKTDFFEENESKFTHSIMSVKGWVFQWTMRRRRRQQHCRCFHLQHLSPSTLRRRRRVSMWVLLRSWRHRDQTMTMTMNSVFYVSYQRRHRCVQPKKTSHSFACGKKHSKQPTFCFWHWFQDDNLQSSWTLDLAALKC